MKLQHKSINIINILLCSVLMVCALYHEPVTFLPSKAYDSQTRIATQTISISPVEAEPEIILERNARTVLNSVRALSTRRVFGRSASTFNGEMHYPQYVLPAFLLFVSLITVLIFGAYTLFRNLISYIQSQIGL